MSEDLHAKSENSKYGLGTIITSPITTHNFSDVYPTALSNEIRGGLHVVEKISDLNTYYSKYGTLPKIKIEENDLTPQRITIGSLVFCMENKTLYLVEAQNNELSEEVLRSEDRIVVSFEEFKEELKGNFEINGFRNYYSGRLNDIYVAVTVQEAETGFPPDYYTSTKMIMDISTFFNKLLAISSEEALKEDLPNLVNEITDLIRDITKRYPFLSYDEADSMTKKFYLYLLRISRMIKGFYDESVVIQTNTKIFCNKKEINCELDPFSCCQKCKGCKYLGLINPKFIPILKLENGRVSILNYYNLKYDEKLHRIVSTVPGNKHQEFNDSLATMGDVKSLIRDKICRENGTPRYSFYDLDFDDETLQHNADGSLRRNEDGSFLDLDGHPINPTIPASVNFLKFNGLPSSAYSKVGHEHPELVNDYELEVFRAQINGKYENLIDRDNIFFTSLNRLTSLVGKLSTFIGMTGNKNNWDIINPETDSFVLGEWNHEDRILICERRLEGIDEEFANLTETVNNFGDIISRHDKTINNHEDRIETNEDQIKRLKQFTGIVDSTSEVIDDNTSLEKLKEFNHEDRILALEKQVDELVKLTKPIIGQLKMYSRKTLIPIDHLKDDFDGWVYPDGRLLEINKWAAAFEVFGTSYNTGGEDNEFFRIPNLQSFIRINNGDKFRHEEEEEAKRNTQEYPYQVNLTTGEDKLVKWYGCVMKHTHTFTGYPITIKTKTHKHNFVGTSSTQTASANHKHKFGNSLYTVLQKLSSHSHDIDITSNISSNIKVWITTIQTSGSDYRKNGLICIHGGSQSSAKEEVPLTTSAASSATGNTKAYVIENFDQISSDTETGNASSTISFTITPSGEVKQSNIEFNNNQDEAEHYTLGSTTFVPKGNVSSEGEDERKESYPTHNWIPTLIYIGKQVPRSKFTILFDSNQGEYSVFYKQSIKIDENVNVKTQLRPNPFQRAGYKFLYWSIIEPFDEEGNEREIPVAQRISNNGRVSWGTFFGSAAAAYNQTAPLYAIWEGFPYSIRFNSNDSTERTYIQSGENVRYGRKFALRANEFARVGYRFMGWAENAFGSKVYDDEQEVSNLTIEENGIVDLYATWKNNEYYIVFEKNGGSGYMSSQKLTYDIAKPLKLCTYKKTGFHFLGWSDTNEGTVKYNDGATVLNLTDVPEGIVHIFAKWEENTYVVTFDSNGGAGEMPNISRLYSEVFNLPLNVFTKAGYVFDGWSKEPDGKIDFVDGQEVVSLTEFQESVNLYAHWKPVSYKVKLDANGGEGEQIPPMDIEFDEEKPLPLNTYTRRGFTWKGWSASSTGGVIYRDGDKVKNLTETEGNIVVLYAVWEPNLYTLNYANYGDGTIEPKQIRHLDEVIIKNPFTITGYNFDYWETNDLPKEHYDPAEIFTMPYTDVTLTGVWSPITYVIKYIPTNDAIGVMADTEVNYDTFVNLSKNNFVRKGYSFFGWATEEGGSKVYEDRATIHNLSDTDGAEIKLYTLWDPNKYMISFIKGNNYATGSMNDQKFTQDVTSTLNKNLFKLTGYHFTKWQVIDWNSEISNQQYYDDQSEARFNLPATLKATWSANVYTVKFHLKGMTNVVESAPVDITATYDDTMVKMPKLTTRDPTTGEATYYLQGWSKSSSSSVKDYDPEVSYRNITAEGTITLYAIWKPVTKEVRFYPNGGHLP